MPYLFCRLVTALKSRCDCCVRNESLNINHTCTHKAEMIMMMMSLREIQAVLECDLRGLTVCKELIFTCMDITG